MDPRFTQITLLRPVLDGYKIQHDLREKRRKAQAVILSTNYRREHAEKINAKRRVDWQRRRRYLRKQKRGEKRCMFCGILLSSPKAWIGHNTKVTKYCEPCRTDPKVKAYLRNIYQRRFHQRQRIEKARRLKQKLPAIREVEPIVFQTTKLAGSKRDHRGRYLPGNGPKAYKSVLFNHEEALPEVTHELTLETAAMDAALLEERKAAQKRQDYMIREQNRMGLRRDKQVDDPSLPSFAKNKPLQNEP